MAIIKDRKKTEANTETTTKTESPALKNPVFENPDEDSSTVGIEPDTGTGTAQSTQRLDSAAALAANSTSLVPRAGNAVTSPVRSIASPFEEFRNAYTVNYDTLQALQATNGNFLDKTSGVSLGDTIILDILSFQPNFVLSPGVEGEEARAYVAYSDDGKVTKDGTPCVDYLADLKRAGYDEAKMSTRTVLVGALVDAGKQPDMVDNLVQIDLPPTCKTLFDRYQIQSAFDIRKGKTTLEKVTRVKMVCRVEKRATPKGSLIWTVTDFFAAG